MSKKDKSQVMDPVIESEVTEDEATKLEEFKRKKRESAQAWKEKKNAEKQKAVENFGKLLDLSKKNGWFDALDDELKSFLVKGANPTTAGNAGGVSTFTKLFGENPAIGSTVSLMEVFQKTLKGKAAIDHQIKYWEEKGIVVSFKEDKENIFNSVYTVEALPSA